jgi:hypothetical protein
MACGDPLLFPIVRQRIVLRLSRRTDNVPKRALSANQPCRLVQHASRPKGRFGEAGPFGH